jgi:ACS family tartrate transporter-like MFS transporter
MLNVSAHEMVRLGTKLIWRLVLPIALLSCVNAIDRMNVSFAAKAMSDDIGLTPATSVSVTEAPASQGSFENRLAAALGDWRIFRCAFTWLLIMTSSYALVFWLPQLVRPMGTSEFEIGVLSSLPQLGLATGLLANGWHSDRTGERQWHTAGGAAIGGVALLAGALLPPGWAALALLTLASAGIGAAQGVFWTVPASLGIGNGRVPVGVIAFISMAGTAGGIVGPMLIGWVRQSTASFVPALILLAMMLIAAVFVIAPLRLVRNPAPEAAP